MRQVLIILTALLAGCFACERERADDLTDRSPLALISADVVYGHKFGLAMTFDVYQPREPNGAAVLLINSGGWHSPVFFLDTETEGGIRLLSDAEMDQIEPRLREFSPWPLLEIGITVFNLRHGSSPRFALPEIVTDLRRAVRFIQDRAAEYGVDPNRIGLWGGSAGGHLALLLGTTPEIGNPNASDDFELSEARVAAIVAYFPVTDLQRFVTNAPELKQQFPALELSPEQAQRLSPIHHVSPDDPPTLIIHGDHDSLVPILEGRSMHEAMLGADVQTEFITIDGADHAFVGEEADVALAQTVEWFRVHLTQSRQERSP
jgi:acetyl esterase/lipase